MRLKFKYTTSNFQPGKEKVLPKVKEKIKELKETKKDLCKPKQLKPVLSDADAKKHLE